MRVIRRTVAADTTGSGALRLSAAGEGRCRLGDGVAERAPLRFDGVTGLPSDGPGEGDDGGIAGWVGLVAEAARVGDR